MGVEFTITGLNEVIAGIQLIQQRLNKPEKLAEQLAEGMRRYAHVLTGYMRITIYSHGITAGAYAHYAPYEVARGGSHDFVALALDELDTEAWLSYVLGDF